jgi:hypothetical protein
MEPRDAISGDADATPPATEREAPPALQLPLLEVALNGAPVQLGIDRETGDRHIVVGPVLLKVLLPLDASAARTLASQLLGGVELPRMAVPKGRR